MKRVVELHGQYDSARGERGETYQGEPCTSAEGAAVTSDDGGVADRSGQDQRRPKLVNEKIGYGISDGAVVLVRPDGHIAYRGRADRPELLAAYCARVFGNATL